MKENRDIRKELAELAPGFTWPEHPAAFDIPRGYFHGLSGQVRSRINELTDEPLPAALRQKNPYDMPAGYFDRLPRAVLKKIPRETPIVSLPRRRRHPRYAWVSAAVIAGLITLSGLLMFPQNRLQPTIDQELASLSNSAIEQYLKNEGNLSGIDALYGDNVNEDDPADALISNFSNEDIRIYLENNVIDSL